MSISKSTTLWCDGYVKSCIEWYGLDGRRSAGLRRDARKLGWTQKDSKDYCPECS